MIIHEMPRLSKQDRRCLAYLKEHGPTEGRKLRAACQTRLQKWLLGGPGFYGDMFRLEERGLVHKTVVSTLIPDSEWDHYVSLNHYKIP